MAEPNEAPFASSLEHLQAELGRIDLLLRMQVARLRAAGGDDSLRGLAVSDAEADALLARPLAAPAWATAPPLPQLEEELRQRELSIARRGSLTLSSRRSLRLVDLGRQFGLLPLDLDLLLLALLPELDLRYERIFGYLQDDLTRRRPSVDLALALTCRDLPARAAALATLAPSAPLRRHGLLTLAEESPAASRLARALVIDERIAGYLLDSNELDARLLPYVHIEGPETRLDELALPPDLGERLLRLLRGDDDDDVRAPVLYLRGAAGAGRARLAAALCGALAIRILILDGAALAALPAAEYAQRLRLTLRETRLQEAGLLITGVDALLGDEQLAARRALVQALDGELAPIFLSASAPWRPAGTPARRWHGVELPLPPTATQVQLWQRALTGVALADDVDLELLAGRHRLTPGRIAEAAAAARQLARQRDPAAPLLAEDLSRACRDDAQPRMGLLAQRVQSLGSWDDLVLPADTLARLHELANQAQARRQVMEQWGFEDKLLTGRGLSALFAGPPGTGKTLAASVIARALQLDLYRIDLSTVMSKYIGETEKQLARLFDEAESSHAILFFDEADAIFGKRTEILDAHDRYANISTSYLLQRIDAFAGTVILASNLRRNLDDAFVRRLRSTIEFAPPDESERLRIWQRVFPPGVPLAAGLDLGFMARRFELAGGHIRNMALAAAFLAAADGQPVGEAHLLRAARREYQNLGRIIDERLFEPEAT